MKVSEFLWKHAKKMKLMFFSTIIIFFMSFTISRFSTFIGSELVGFIAKSVPQTIDLKSFINLITLLFISMLLSSFCMYCSHTLETKFRPHFISNTSRDLFEQSLKHSSAFFADEMPGRIISKFNKVQNSSERIFDYGMSFIRTSTTLMITILFIAFMNIYLSAFYLITSIIFIYITSRKRISLRQDSQKEADLESMAAGVLSDAINNSNNVKAFGNLKHEKKYFFSTLKKYLKYYRKASRKRILTTYKNNSLYDILSISFYLGVFYTWYTADISVANVVFIISSISAISSSIKEFSYGSVGFIKNWGELKDGIDFLYKEHEIKDVSNAKKLNIKKGGIIFDHIDYAYKNKNKIFHNFYLEINSGEKIGLIGRSGSGKSTLIKLLARYYDLNKGKIKINGKDISRVTQDSLRRSISAIPQDTSLFNRTIIENIRYGNTKATDDEVIKAAKQSYCHDFIMSLPEGYNSRVGEKGVMLSGGERQRIAIARAILQDAPILILDEATSALDSESEHYIQKALKDLMKKKTVIAIAHRLSTLKEMDRIIVMEDGKIKEDGTQAELLKNKDLFYNFYKMQSEGFLTME